jgi:hypothetical protein
MVEQCGAFVVIRATDTELDLSDSPAELRRLAVALTGLALGERHRFDADITADPAPYTRVLAALEFVASGGAVRVTVMGDTLHVSGSRESLDVLASFFEFEDGDTPGTHHHHEWREGNKYIAADSRPLVVSVA